MEYYKVDFSATLTFIVSSVTLVKMLISTYFQLTISSKFLIDFGKTLISVIKAIAIWGVFVVEQKENSIVKSTI